MLWMAIANAMLNPNLELLTAAKKVASHSGKL